MTTCTAYEQGYCIYGKRCQFMHSAVDFSDFDQQRTRYQNLLNENARIMTERIAQAADPDVSVFNIAHASKGRLAVFEEFAPEQSRKTRSKRGGQKQRENKQFKRFFSEADW